MVKASWSWYRVRRRAWHTGVVWGAVLVTAFLNGSVPDVALAAPQYHALLVGVTQYPYLPQEYWLHGPANDVALMQDVLTRRFPFTSERITVLAGWPREEALRPTRANIARAFRRLADIAGPDDQVVIFLAGHGSQQPADDDPDDLEPDGLDEIFLPADAGRWTKTIGHVENAIVDDEIRVWVSAIRAKGAFVWVIVDTCHAGTMTRGAPPSRNASATFPSASSYRKRIWPQQPKGQRSVGAPAAPLACLPACWASPRPQGAW